MVKRCILSKFYIKPQPRWRYRPRRWVVSYRNSTSNHNTAAVSSWDEKLYLIEILHQTTTPRNRKRTSIVVSYRNSTSNHNKPFTLIEVGGVVSYRNSTSNHNLVRPSRLTSSLYLIEILHQTTTTSSIIRFVLRCILSKFYIKPQLRLERELAHCSCILSKFYIKPQRGRLFSCRFSRCILSKFYIKPQHRSKTSCFCRVVSYRNSTSNHNSPDNLYKGGWVVSYRNSTSNHNFRELRSWGQLVVSYRNSTSNHNTEKSILHDSSVVSYRNSTSNHNC